MPNIIEQQDLLKGLPDARLATLLQNPVADIPPFLVAAEAQRRQAIRQQFAGSAPKESVVDSLTKQLANVPQNIQAPAQTPVNIPQTPQMQGVMALQNQQQQQPQQQMREGGPVRRFAGEGYVAPTFRGRQGAGGYLPGEEQPSVAMPSYGDVIPKVRDWVEDTARRFVTPISQLAEEDRLRALEEEKLKAEKRIFPKIPETSSGGMSLTKPQLTEAGKIGTSDENKDKGTPQPLAGETPDEYRARLEELLQAQEPSSWEKAQRWFAMAEQFFDPSKTTGQSIAGAGRAFAEMTGEQSRAQREAELASKRGLLEYDIAERNRLLEKEAEEAKAKSLLAKEERERTTLSAKDYAGVLQSRLESINKSIVDAQKMLDPAEMGTMMLTDEQKAAAAKRIEDLTRARDEVAGLLASLGETAYGSIPYDTFSLTNRNFVR